MACLLAQCLTCVSSLSRYTCNLRVCVFQVLCELCELRVLYLHGNNIFILSEVDRLSVLPHLHTITLHGNVIETIKGYR